MEADVRLNGNVVLIEGDRAAVSAPDLEVNSRDNRSKASTQPLRRALVHDTADGLTINFDHDYPAGVSIYGQVKLEDGLKGDLKVAGDATITGDFTTVNRIFAEELHGSNLVLQDSGPFIDEVWLSANQLRTLLSDVHSLKARVTALEAKG